MGLFDFLKSVVKSDAQIYNESRSKVTVTNNYDNNFHLDSFRFTVEDVFNITGRGTVVVGRISSGSIKVGDTVTITNATGNKIQTIIGGIEMFRKIMTEAKEGDNVGILLSNVSKDQISKGAVITK